jgi:protease PrsW
VTSQAWTPVRVPSFWLLTAAVGVTGLGVLLAVPFAAFTTPLSMLAALPLVAVYTVAVLLLIRSIDQLARRPWWLVALAFGWGGTVSVAVGAASGLFLDDLLAKATSPWFAATWGAALVAPTAEELAKGAGVLLLFLAARPHLRTVFAGAVYGAIIGVGFAAVEDIGYALISADDPLPDDVSAAVSVVVLRVLVPGVAGHALFTATVGAGVTYLLLRTDRSLARRIGVLVAAIGLAWLAHAAVNAPFALTVPTWPRPAGDLAGYLLIVWVPTAAALWWLARLRRTEFRQAVLRLADLELAAATSSEAEALTGYADRSRVRRLVRDGVQPAAHGAAVRAAREVQRALLALADELTRPATSTAPWPPPAGVTPGWPPPGGAASGWPPPAGVTPGWPPTGVAAPGWPPAAVDQREWPAPLTGQPAAPPAPPTYPAYPYPYQPGHPGPTGWYPVTAYPPGPGYPVQTGWYPPGYPSPLSAYPQFPVPWPPAPFQPVLPPPSPDPLEQARDRLARARTALREVSGEERLPELPQRSATVTRPIVLSLVLLVGVVGVLHWSAALAAVALAVTWLVSSRLTGRPVRPLDLAATAVAVASLHLWAASLLAVALFAHEF